MFYLTHLCSFPHLGIDRNGSKPQYSIQAERRAVNLWCRSDIRPVEQQPSLPGCHGQRDSPCPSACIRDHTRGSLPSKHPIVSTHALLQAKEDDVIPLSEPVRTMSGDVVDSIAVARGTQICIPIACINRSTAIWGADAKVFSPERWLDESTIPEKAQEVQGYRHLLSFIDGTRTCLGKLFAVVELKVCFMPAALPHQGL